MANIVELKDSTNTKCYPLTKAQAVYFDDNKNIVNFKDDFYEFVENGTIKAYAEGSWVQNRVMISNGVLTEITSTTFAHTGFIFTDRDITIKVKSGYKITGWESQYNTLGYTANSFVSGWVTGEIIHTYRSGYPYVILCVMKDDSSTISATEAASAVDIYYSISSGFKDDFYKFTEDGTVKSYAEGSWVQNRIMISDGVLTETTSTSFAHTGFIFTDKDLTIKTKSGYKVTGWESKYNTLGYTANSITSGWVTGEVTHAYRAGYPYVILCVMKDDSSAIGTVEADSAVDIYYSVKSDLVSETYLNSIAPVPANGQIIYEGDTKSSSNYIVNAVSYNDGTIIACRSNGTVIRINKNGTTETLLSLTGTNMDWRLCWMDSNENVYVSPHASYGSLNVSDRGLYKLTKGATTFTKVISLYNTSSSIATEKVSNDDTIWTMCEDSNGNLYAGVYAHTVRANPAIYKSTDGGNTWTYIFNFNTAALTDGMHIHTLIYSIWQRALYCIVGEVNTIFKSTDGGSTWVDLNVILNAKGSAMCATPYGILIGSDGAYNCEIDLLFNDDVTHKTVFSGWANTIFAIRRSDITGIVYAFTKVDSSVNQDSVYPPIEAITSDSSLNTWKTTSGHNVASWTKYYNSVINTYPDDAIRPQHCAILVSRDGGYRWEVLKKYVLTVNSSTGNNYIDGFWTTGWFNNGECLTGRFENNSFVKPIIISEGKHKFTSEGCDLDGEILVKTNSSSIVDPI